MCCKERERKRGTVNIRRHGNQTCRERIKRVSEGILIFFNPNKLIWMPLNYKFITLAGTVQKEITSPKVSQVSIAR